MRRDIYVREDHHLQSRPKIMCRKETCNSVKKNHPLEILHSHWVPDDLWAKVRSRGGTYLVIPYYSSNCSKIDRVENNHSLMAFCKSKGYGFAHQLFGYHVLSVLWKVTWITQWSKYRPIIWSSTSKETISSQKLLPTTGRLLEIKAKTNVGKWANSTDSTQSQNATWVSGAVRRQQLYQLHHGVALP